MIDLAKKTSIVFKKQVYELGMFSNILINGLRRIEAKCKFIRDYVHGIIRCGFCEFVYKKLIFREVCVCEWLNRQDFMLYRLRVRRKKTLRYNERSFLFFIEKYSNGFNQFLGILLSDIRRDII